MVAIYIFSALKIIVLAACRFFYHAVCVQCHHSLHIPLGLIVLIVI